MSNTLRIKRRASGAPGAPPSLANAELAFNEVDDVLYYGKGTGGAGGTATTIPAIGGAGAFLTLSTTQTVTGNKTFAGDVFVSTQTATDNSTKAASTAFVKAQGYLTGNQSITFSGDASGSGTTSVTLTLANVGTAGTYTKVTTDAKGRVTAGSSLSASDIPSITASKVSDFDAAVRLNRLDQLAAPTAAVTFNSQRATGLADPVNTQDAATKGYVDTASQGLKVKDAVRVATTTNITLSGLQSVDGVSLLAGDRVLVKNQTNAALNGLYAAATGAWSRTTDANENAEVTSGLFVFVNEGTVNANSGWTLTTTGAIALGTTLLSFSQFSGAGQIDAGAGLTRSGTTLNVGGTAGRIVVNADTIDLDTTGVTPGTYLSVTVDAYGRVTAGANTGITYDGGTF